jgi:hypothetical protein
MIKNDLSKLPISVVPSAQNFNAAQQLSRGDVWRPEWHLENRYQDDVMRPDICRQLQVLTASLAQ